MNFLYAFLFAGVMCALAEVILDNTKLTPGHVTSLFTIFGAFLGFLGIYEKFIYLFGGGATVIISNFGYMLYKGVKLGLETEGIIGLFSGMLKYSSCAIVGAIVFAFIFTLIFKPRD